LFQRHQYKDSIPARYFEVNRSMNLNPEMETLEKALEIGRYLRANVKGGRGLGLSSEQTLEKMLGEKGGVCSDFSQIFCIFCLINDIKVKEWGCVDGLYNGKFWPFVQRNLFARATNMDCHRHPQKHSF
jgi:hypothetical protein